MVVTANFMHHEGMQSVVAPLFVLTITLLSEAREPVATWVLRQAQPNKWTGPTFNAKGGGEVAVEEISFVHEGIEYQ